MREAVRAAEERAAAAQAAAVATAVRELRHQLDVARLEQKRFEQRAAAGLTQEQLASQMHMGVEQLAALERGDHEQLPEPVFIKAMVRRLSSHLGLNADAMVQTLGPLTTAKTAKSASRATSRSVAPQKQSKINPVPLIALAGLAGLGVVVWSNASELMRFTQRFTPANQTTTENEQESLPEPEPAVAIDFELISCKQRSRNSQMLVATSTRLLGS